MSRKRERTAGQKGEPIEKTVQTWYNAEVRSDVRVVFASRKSLTIGVDRDGVVVVRAPRGTERIHIDREIVRHRRWIGRRKRESARFSLDLSDGALVTLLSARRAQRTVVYLRFEAARTRSDGRARKDARRTVRLFLYGRLYHIGARQVGLMQQQRQSVILLSYCFSDDARGEICRGA